MYKNAVQTMITLYVIAKQGAAEIDPVVQWKEGQVITGCLKGTRQLKSITHLE